MNTNISGKKIQTAPIVLGARCYLSGSGQTLDHFLAAANGAAQDHAENYAEDHHHSNADAQCSNDVELAVEDIIDGFWAGLNLEGFKNLLLGADVRDKLFLASH